MCVYIYFFKTGSHCVSLAGLDVAKWLIDQAIPELIDIYLTSESWA